jgi:hypothetical protein
VLLDHESSPDRWLDVIELDVEDVDERTEVHVAILPVVRRRGRLRNPDAPLAVGRPVEH